MGFVLDKKVGEAVRAGETLCTVHGNDEARTAAAVARVARAYTVGDLAPAPRPLVLERLA